MSAKIKSAWERSAIVLIYFCGCFQFWNVYGASLWNMPEFSIFTIIIWYNSVCFSMSKAFPSMHYILSFFLLALLLIKCTLNFSTASVFTSITVGFSATIPLENIISLKKIISQNVVVGDDNHSHFLSLPLVALLLAGLDGLIVVFLACVVPVLTVEPFSFIYPWESCVLFAVFAWLIFTLSSFLAIVISNRTQLVADIAAMGLWQLSATAADIAHTAKPFVANKVYVEGDVISVATAPSNKGTSDTTSSQSTSLTGTAGTNGNSGNSSGSPALLVLVSASAKPAFVPPIGCTTESLAGRFVYALCGYETGCSVEESPLLCSALIGLVAVAAIQALVAVTQHKPMVFLLFPGATLLLVETIFKAMAPSPTSDGVSVGEGKGVSASSNSSAGDASSTSVGVTTVPVPPPGTAGAAAVGATGAKGGRVNGTQSQSGGSPGTHSSKMASAGSSGIASVTPTATSSAAAAATTGVGSGKASEKGHSGKGKRANKGGGGNQ